MRCISAWALGLALLMPACASPQGEVSGVGAVVPVDKGWVVEGQLSQSMTLFNFLGKTPSVRLEQPYRFSAEVAGQTRKARARQAQLAFEREFPKGTAVADVIRSIQAGLSEEFVYEPSYAAWATGATETKWSMSLSIGEGIRVVNARFLPVDPDGEATIRMVRYNWSISERPAALPAIGDSVAPIPLVTITDWDAGLEQEHDWQLSRGIDPWVIPKREYVQRRRKSTGLTAFFQFGLIVLSGHSRS